MVTAGATLPLPAYGQHLLRSREVAAQIAAVALPDGEEPRVVVEVGVGAGALTKALLARTSCQRLIGYEVDSGILSSAMQVGGLLARVGAVARALPEEATSWSPTDWTHKLSRENPTRCLVFKADFLTCRSLPGDCKVAVGNVPYRISASITTKLLLHDPPLQRIVLTVQAEFARKLLARPGSPKFSRLSVLAAVLCTQRDLAGPGMLPPEAFSPAPRVDSAVIRLIPHQKQLSHKGSPVPAQALDRLLRLLLDGARASARGLGMEATLSLHEDAAGALHCPKVGAVHSQGLA